MHPGEVLREEFLVPLKLSAGALARKMDVPRTRIERIAEEKTGITADTSAPRRSCGSTCKLITTCRWPLARSARNLARRHRHDRGNRSLLSDTTRKAPNQKT